MPNEPRGEFAQVHQGGEGGDLRGWKTRFCATASPIRVSASPRTRSRVSLPSSSRPTPPSRASTAARASASRSRRSSSRCTAGASGWRASPAAAPFIRDSVARAGSEEGLSARSILYVEDNEANRMIVRDLLKRTKTTSSPRPDGEAGVAKALELRPGLILMDIQLPKISGLEAIRRLRAEAATQQRRSSRSLRSRFPAMNTRRSRRRHRLSRQALQPVRFAEAHTAALAET